MEAVLEQYYSTIGRVKSVEWVSLELNWRASFHSFWHIICHPYGVHHIVELVGILECNSLKALCLVISNNKDKLRICELTFYCPILIELDVCYK